MRLFRADFDMLLRHLAAKSAPLRASDYSGLVAEVFAGRAFAGIDRDGTPLALGGVFVPDLGGPGTCWLSVVPGRLERQLVVAALLMRRVIRAAAPEFGGDGLAAYVDDSNPHGARLAAALGFEATAVTFGRIRRWGTHGRADRQDGTQAIQSRG